ncbi:MAG TPA: CheR family methyltransferase [Kofleriaceae bacterium]|nr:CheR family methyltransferase [Kofleriaceae bacterium]
MSELDPAASDLERRLATWTGLDLERGAHRNVLRDVIARRAAETGATPHAYAGAVITPHEPEASRLIDIITVSHSWFFRDPEQMAIVETLLDRQTQELNIWLAACAGGEEPYSIAMLAEVASRAPYILATDINREALTRARIGRYGRWALRELPASLHDRFVAREDGTYEVSPRIRRMVELRRHNLMDPAPAARSLEGWDLILCRNVLMYLRPADATATIRRLADSLRPGGHLILGANDILPVAPAGLRFVSMGGRYILQRSRDRAVDPAGVPRRAGTEPMWIPVTPGPPSPELERIASRSPLPAPAAGTKPLGTAGAMTRATQPLPALPSGTRTTQPLSALPPVTGAPQPASVTGARQPISVTGATQPISVTGATQPLPVVASTVRPGEPFTTEDPIAAGTRRFEAGDFSAAAAHYASAMDRDPLAPEAAALTGIACFLSGDAISALCHLRRALALDPGLWQAELYLAMCHEQLGAPAAAMAAYQCLRSALAARPPVKEPGVLAHLEVWRADALEIARHKTRR